MSVSVGTLSDDAARIIECPKCDKDKLIQIGGSGYPGLVRKFQCVSCETVFNHYAINGLREIINEGRITSPILVLNEKEKDIFIGIT